MATLTPSIPTMPSVDWGPVFAGAIGAAALGLVFIAFGAAIGLTLTSPWPGSGMSLVATGVFVMYWTALVQILSFAAGGYVAGRLRPATTVGSEERQFRDGAHGFLVWGVGVVMMALVTAFGGGVAARSASTVAAGAATGIGAASQAMPTPADYAVDLLLRPGPNASAATPAPTTGNDVAIRQEISRLFSSVIRNRELTVRDRDYLVTLAQNRAGLAPAEAQQRVTDAVNEARTLELKAREQADKARKASVLTAFTAAATLMIGLAVACAAAAVGGRHRDENISLSVFGRPVW